MKLIVGLGNPGREYQNTRHNIGFMMIDKIVDKYNLQAREKFNGQYYEVNINNEKIILLKPLSYMNLSGTVIKKFIDFYKINIDDIFIIHDDLDLEVGKVKLRYSGGSGGHNGLKNIEANIGTKNYKRMRIGISNNKNIDTKDYVLGKFSKEEMNVLNQIVEKFPNILEDYMVLSFDNLMNKYN